MKLFITSQIPNEIFQSLQEEFEVEYHNSQIPLTQEKILERIPDKDALLCPLSDKIDEKIMEAGKQLKIIANYGAGYDNIDICAAKARNIIVTNAPAPSSAVSTAELTFSLLLAIARNLIQGDALTRRGEFLGWRPTFFLGHELRGKTLGIIGLGNIGKQVAKRALAFDMNVIYFSRNRKEEWEREMGITYCPSIEDLLTQSDFVTLHTAFVPELRHLISEKEFKMMKDSAYLINASRGPVVDEAALVCALQQKEIAGAALDVYEYEPKVKEELLNLDNVILSPHLGNATWEARMEMGIAAKENLLDFKSGKKPRNQVN